jgi:transcriptional regulator with XRE-family HTH domain
MGSAAGPSWEAAQTLDRLLKREGWSSTRLARELGVAQATISRYRSGERAPDPDMLTRICRVSGLSADEILGLPTDREWPSHEVARLRRWRAGVERAVAAAEKPQRAR